MNEVEKMYRNAHVYPRVYGDITKETFEDKAFNMADMCNEAFTAEKQLELIKWLSTKELKIRTNKQPYAVYIGVLGNDNTCFFGCEGLYFEQTLAEVINHLWQDLTEEERKQIKEILE